MSPLQARVVFDSRDTPFRPGDRVRFVDREAPRPPELRLTGTIAGLYLFWDGKTLELDGVGVIWDDPRAAADEFAVREGQDVLQRDELDQLEVIGS